MPHYDGYYDEDLEDEIDDWDYFDDEDDEELDLYEAGLDDWMTDAEIDPRDLYYEQNFDNDDEGDGWWE